MKCINKKWIIIAVISVGTLLGASGCGSTTELTDAYNVYDTSAQYGIASSDTAQTVSFFASDLCVTDDTNSDSSDLNTASSSEAAGVFNLDTQTVLYSKNIYEKLYPASTTKILTAYLALKYGNLDDVITVSHNAANVSSDSSVCGLQEGDQMTLRQLLYGLLLCSGNDAATAIAEYISGDTDSFADLMNEEAAALGCTGSHFVNPHGLPDDDHYTTVYDLYLIFNAAIQYDDFLTVINTADYTVSYTDAAGEDVSMDWSSTDRYLLGTTDDPDDMTVVGGKTGTTNAAGACLVLLSQNDAGENVISIVLKADTHDNLYLSMTELLNEFGNL